MLVTGVVTYVFVSCVFAGQIVASHTLIITKPATSPSTLNVNNMRHTLAVFLIPETKMTPGRKRDRVHLLVHHPPRRRRHQPVHLTFRCEKRTERMARKIRDMMAWRCVDSFNNLSIFKLPKGISPLNSITSPIGYSDTGYSDNPTTVTFFWPRKGPSFTENHR